MNNLTKTLSFKSMNKYLNTIFLSQLQFKKIKIYSP